MSWMAAATIGAGLISGAGQKSTNISNAKQAQKQMDFQERMRDTAHQAEVKDLRAAGLNPILSAGGSGAASPGGAMAKMENVGAKAASTATAVAQLSNLKATGELIQAQIGETTAKTVLTENEAVKSGVQATMWEQAQKALGIVGDIPSNAKAALVDYRRQQNRKKHHAETSIHEKQYSGRASPKTQRELKRRLRHRDKDYSGRGKSWPNPGSNAVDANRYRVGKNTLR